MKQILNMLQKMNLSKKLVVFILLLSFFPTNLFAGIDYSKYDAIFLSEGEEVLKCTLGAMACFVVYFILHKSIYKNAENEPSCFIVLFHSLLLLGGVVLLIPLVSYLHFFVVGILMPIALVVGSILWIFGFFNKDRIKLRLGMGPMQYQSKYQF